MDANTKNIINELDWLNLVLTEFAQTFTTCMELKPSWSGIPLPELETDNSAYANFVNENKLSVEERLILITSLVPHLRSHVLSQ